MVYIKLENGTEKKFACIKCIKGHRSSKCEHSNRELIEIRRKGRPVSQCDSCRQLRKTKQMHLKCLCNSNKPLPIKSLETRDSNTCLECKSLKGFCICYNSSCSSEGSITPPMQLCHPPRHHMIIPIHDPSDDIDSDTPKYKSEETEIPDKTAVLGNLTDTSSEELMNRIYSVFNDKDKLNEELVELSNNE